jgi:hypothetical protein
MAVRVTEPALFGEPDRADPEVDERTPGQRRRDRHLDAMRHGQHPLSVALQWPIRLHPDAAPPEDRDAEGLRCGGCRFRRLLPYHGRVYPKCCWPESDPGERVSHGGGTDVAAWWPACAEYEAGEP